MAMPGPISDSYDPEWGTAERCQEIRESLSKVYEQVSNVLGNESPMYILDLVNAELPKEITASLSEKEWRLIRFAIERALDSI
jgi:hypothetical protein